MGKQRRDHALPEHEARERSDVPAAFPAFEHETPGALVEEQLEQVRRGHVQVGRDAFGLELTRLVGPATRD